jgi:hypothetical protein
MSFARPCRATTPSSVPCCSADVRPPARNELEAAAHQRHAQHEQQVIPAVPKVPPSHVSTLRRNDFWLIGVAFFTRDHPASARNRR